MVENSIIQELIRSQFFHLLSMLVCIGVVVWLFVKYYNARNQESDADVKLRRINTFYISGILLFIIIELVTAICMGNSHHADILSFVSFASTISSLIMSVVAIIFTIVYSSRGEEHYLRLDAASDRVHGALTVFERKAEDMDKSVERFQSISAALTSHMDSILGLIADLQEKTNRLDVKTDMLLENDQPSKEKGRERVKADAELVKRFIKSGSFSGNLVLYACSLVKENGKTLSIKAISASERDAAYYYGYLIASSSLGILDGKFSSDECTISTCEQNLKEMTLEMIKNYIANKKPKDKQEKLQALLDKVNTRYA